MSMQAGRYVKMIVSEEIMKHCDTDREFGDMVESLMRARHGDAPDFVSERTTFEKDAVLELEREAMRRKGVEYNDLRFLSLMSGVSGEGLAGLGLGMPEDKMTFVTICPNDANTLHRTFQQADVIVGDVRDPEVQTEVKKNDYAVGHASMLCQALSLANKNRDKHDERVQVGVEAVKLLCAVNTKAMIVENVAPFAELEDFKEVFDSVMNMMAKVHPNTKPIVTNAKHTGSAQQRSRLYIVGGDGVDVDAIVSEHLAKNQKAAATAMTVDDDGGVGLRLDVLKRSLTLPPHVCCCYLDSQTQLASSS